MYDKRDKIKSRIKTHCQNLRHARAKAASSIVARYILILMDEPISAVTLLYPQ